MDACPTRRLRRRVVLVTFAAAAIAGAHAGSAFADPGLAPLVSGVTEPPPALTEPIATVESTVEPALAPVQAPVAEVASTVEDAVAAVDTSVPGVAKTVDATVPGVAKTVDETLGTPGSTRYPPAGEDSAPATSTSHGEGASSVSAEDAVVHARPVSPSAELGQNEPAQLAPRTAAATARATARPVQRPATPSGAPRGAASTASIAVDAAPPAAAGSRARIPGSTRAETTGPVQPQLGSGGQNSFFGGLLPSPPSPALLVVALLGLLALVPPRAGGERLHAVVAVLRPADVRFRLVRPG